jgi:CheY-like chemotaxis protein
MSGDESLTAGGIRILIAADAAAHAEAAAAALRGEFEDITCSVGADRIVADFDRERAPLLVLAFEHVADAESCLRALEQSSESLHAFAHRRLLLCRREEQRVAYDVCLQGRFDDYVTFWPTDADPQRLPMAAHRAALDLNAMALRSQRQLDWVREAQGLDQLEPQLSASATWLLERVDQALGQAEVVREAVRQPTQEFETRVAALENTLNWMRHWALQLGDEWHAVVGTARKLRAQAARTRPQVLMVDDDEFQHRLLARMLGDTGVDLLFATSVGDAMSLLQVRRPDCILMDIGLPDLNGIEAVRMIKSAANYAHLRIVMLTGVSDESALQRSLDAGASGYIAKPFNRATLLARMRGLLPETARDGG